MQISAQNIDHDRVFPGTNRQAGTVEFLSRRVRVQRAAQGLPGAPLRTLADMQRATRALPDAPVLPPDMGQVDPALSQGFDPAFLIRHGVIPVSQGSTATVVASCRPDLWPDAVDELARKLGPVTLALASEQTLHAMIAQAHGAAMVAHAETQVPDHLSCRTSNRTNVMRRSAIMVAAVLLGVTLAVWPKLFVAALVCVALSTLVASQVLKLLALWHDHRASATDPAGQTLPAHLPSVSLMVPLLQESDIAGTLLKRLDRLRYPRDRLEVLLVVEANDAKTRALLDRTTLSDWMRVIVVPAGTIQTKPRALNFAMEFCCGDIIGIYDAEDAPAPDQLLRVAARFATARADVACLQGVLHYYNSAENWMARCFTLEYATWFRLILPGLVKAGFPVPLGGTTVFLRRAALRRLGGWDAHNVTEDADLGLRLARFGYRTEMLDSVTQEEANARMWPWVKQRSRWLKGYMLTYAVHMRRPLRLWRDLGTKGFLGVQLVFLTGFLQFLLAPVLWSFWVVLFGLSHPFDQVFGPAATLAVIGLFLMAEAVSLLVGFLAADKIRALRLWPWVPTLMLYYPLGVIAAYKALWEVFAKPFFWDKTAHGVSRIAPPA